MEEASYFLDARYSGREGWTRFGEIAGDFDFGRRLPRAAFPPEFVESYVGLAAGEPVDYDNDRVYFVANLSSGPTICLYGGFFTPDFIQSQNAIIAESMYAEEGAVIMPPRHYAIGEVHDDWGELRIMICLDEASDHHGHLFLWRLAHDPLGTGDNTGGLAALSTTIDGIFPMLMSQTEAEAALRASPGDLLPRPALLNAIEHAYVVFSPYKKRFKAEVCLCPSCFSELDRRLLMKTPLRSLPGSLLIQYHWSAHGAAEEQRQNDLRYLLPRSFALLAGNDADTLAHLETSLSKLGGIPWRTEWPNDERQSVTYVFRRLFLECIANTTVGPYWQGLHPQGCALCASAGAVFDDDGQRRPRPGIHNRRMAGATGTCGSDSHGVAALPAAAGRWGDHAGSAHDSRRVRGRCRPAR